MADPLLLLKLALVPTVVWLGSVAARKWGHAVGGYLGGMPLVGGPITLYIALDHGTAFAAKLSLVTLAAVAGQAAHLMLFAFVGRRFGWLPALLTGWLGYALVGALLAHLVFPPWVALGYAAGGLLLAWRLLPRTRENVPLPAIPRIELALRLAAALALATFLLLGAATFGPVWSGVLMSVPITGSVLPPFTLKLYGAQALARLQRGFITGLTGFTSFFFVLSVALVPLGITVAFALAVAAAIAAVMVFTRFGRRDAVGND
jgi:hypothetical protein